MPYRRRCGGCGTPASSYSTTEAEAAAAAHDRGMTTAEIGELLGVSQPTAWRRVRDGRRLREEARRGA